MARSSVTHPSVDAGTRAIGRLLAGGLAAGMLMMTAVAGPSGALAQELSEGITVVGYGEASAPAETAEMQLLVSEANNYGNPIPPDPDAIPGEAQRESIAPLVAALVAAGIPEDDVVVVVSLTSNQFYGPGGPGSIRVDVSLDEPSQERIDELISASVVGAAQENLVLVQVGVLFGVDDCASLDRDARAAAFADAESRADVQADVMGLGRGDVLSASDTPLNASSLDPYYGVATSSKSSCSPDVATASFATGISVPTYDATGEAEVSVYAQVAVTFAMTEGTAAATPTS